MNVYAILARLLDYPSDDLGEHLPDAGVRLASDPSLSEADRAALLTALSHLALRGVPGLQQEYVQTFDITPENSLHLTHHTFGESRERGPALVALGEEYKAAGLVPLDGELPDYLPLMLEYAALLEGKDPDAARRFLAEARPIVDMIATRLECEKNLYAPFLRFVANRGRARRAAA